MKPSRNHGFVLLEMIFAIALFSVVATAMVVALDRIAATSTEAAIESAIYRRMTSVMADVTVRRPQLGRIEFPADGSGVSVVVDTTPDQKSGLDSMYRVRVTGSLRGVNRTGQRLIYVEP